MSIVVIGVNHRTAPLDLLERLTVDDATQSKVLSDLIARQHISEAVVLSTCNRTEVYAQVEKFHPAYAELRDWFCSVSFLPPESVSDHLYVHHDADAASHLFEVAAGLDSAVLGENEILGQVKRSWETAQAEQAAGPSLNLLFRHALEVGKRVRTETGISRSITSVSQAAVVMAADRLDTLRGRTVLVLGAGDMAEGMVASLQEAGVAEILIVNRTAARAKELAASCGGTALKLSELPEALSRSDVLLSSTGANSLMIEFGQVAAVIARRSSSLLIVDVAVPRDVDPAVSDLDGVTLLDMDDLRAFADVGLVERRREAEAARSLLDEELDRFIAVASAREVAPLVTSMWSRAEEIRLAELDRFAGRLASLDAADREMVEALTKGLVAKFLHQPTVELKSAAGSSRGERLAEALRELHGL